MKLFVTQVAFFCFKIPILFVIGVICKNNNNPLLNVRLRVKLHMYMILDMSLSNHGENAGLNANRTWRRGKLNPAYIYKTSPSSKLHVQLEIDPPTCFFCKQRNATLLITSTLSLRLI